MLQFILLFLFITTVWAALAATNVIWPFKLFGTRLKALKSLGLSLVAFMAGSVALNVIDPDFNREPIGITSNVATAALSNSGTTACGTGGHKLDDVVAVAGEHDLHLGPGLDHPTLKNEKASAALGETYFHQINGSTTVRRHCAQDGWTEVQIVEPDWLTDVRGWVPDDVLRTIERTASGERVYVETDFYWDDDTSSFKTEIVAAVNQISRENRNCKAPDTGSVTLSPSRSTPGDPVFFVTCGSGADVFNVWFRPSDVGEGKSFAAIQPLAQSAAVDACEAVAFGAATHPSTVRFSRFRDLGYSTHASGRARVTSTFTAKNGLGLELKYQIDCLFEGAALIETNIFESTN